MDGVDAESNLMSAARPTNVLGKLHSGRVRMARRRRCADKRESAGDRGECKLGVIGRVEEVLYSQIGPVKEILREMFVVKRAKQGGMKRTNHAGVNQIRIAEYERVGSPRIVRNTD